MNNNQSIINDIIEIGRLSVTDPDLNTGHLLTHFYSNIHSYNIPNAVFDLAIKIGQLEGEYQNRQVLLDEAQRQDVWDEMAHPGNLDVYETNYDQTIRYIKSLEDQIKRLRNKLQNIL